LLRTIEVDLAFDTSVELRVTDREFCRARVRRTAGDDLGAGVLTALLAFATLAVVQALHALIGGSVANFSFVTEAATRRRQGRQPIACVIDDICRLCWHGSIFPIGDGGWFGVFPRLDRRIVRRGPIGRLTTAGVGFAAVGCLLSAS
jgi:hypothetical protein